MIRWVFLDVGNVLLDEDPLTYLVFRRHVEAVTRVRPETSFGELLAGREARAAAGSRWPVFEVVSAFLDERQCAEVWERASREVRERFAELSPVIPGSVELVDRLSRRCRLGLIANQGPECRDRLEALGLLDRFEVVALSEERGHFKPDLGLFRWAIGQAGAGPADCLMVGDRLDFDLVPAAALGLRTAWVRWPRRAAKGWLPDERRAVEYRDSLERSSAASTTPRLDWRPTWQLDEIRDLDRTLIEAGALRVRRPRGDSAKQ